MSVRGAGESGGREGSPLTGCLGHALEVLRIRSTASSGTARLAEYLRDEVLRDLPIKSELIAATDRSRRDYNLLARFEPGGDAAGLLLVTHLDTVEPGEPSLWTETGGDPFNALIKGDKIYGLGSADTKLDWLCKAEALRRTLPTGKIRRPVYLLGTFGEETGMTGSREFIAAAAFKSKPVAALVGEPTELAPVTKTKGRLLLTLSAYRPPEPSRQWWLRPVRFFGRSAHASQPELGSNAIRRALGALPVRCALIASIEGGDAGNKVPAVCHLLVDADHTELLGRLAVAGAEIDAGRLLNATPVDPRNIDAVKEAINAIEKVIGERPEEDATFSPPRATVCVTGIRAARGRLTVNLDLRLLPAQQPSELLGEVNAVAEQVGRRFAPVEVEVRVEIDNPPLALPADSDLVLRTCSALRRLDAPASPGTKAGCTEAGIFAAAGVPALVLGPGAAYGNIHAPNEFNSVDQLLGAVSIYEAILQEFCAK